MANAIKGAGGNGADLPINTGKTYKTRKENPRVGIFKLFYLDPSSDTFWNIRGSAIRAGYKEDYAENISNSRPKWWIELQESAEYNRASMLSLAENNLKKTMMKENPTETQEKLKHDASKFVAERVGKQFYSTRQEVTGADGRRLFLNETRDSAKMPLATLFKGVSPTTSDK